MFRIHDLNIMPRDNAAGGNNASSTLLNVCNRLTCVQLKPDPFEVKDNISISPL